MTFIKHLLCISSLSYTLVTIVHEYRTISSSLTKY
nr:MAG TPA: hypothetical protein [Caudoviricetes sp.]